MMREIRITIVMIAVVAFAGSAHGVLYVDATSGNDLIGDGSWASPYATIQKAVRVCNDGVSGEDTVHVRPGTYAGFLNEEPNGNPPITYVYVQSCDPNGQMVGENWQEVEIHSDRDGNTAGPFVANNTSGGSNCQAFLLEGFHLVGPGAGVNAVLGHPDAVGVANCYGANPGSSNADVHVRSCVIRKFDAGVQASSYGLAVQNSLIYDNGVGVSVANDSFGTQRDLRNCTIIDNQRGILAAQGIIDVYNCILWDNFFIDYRVDNFVGAITVWHTDFGSSEEIGGASVTWNTHENINDPPQLQSNYELTSTSPCIDEGSNTLYLINPAEPNEGYYTDKDLFGGARIQNAVIDMGADSYSEPDPNDPNDPNIPDEPNEPDDPNLVPPWAFEVKFSLGANWVQFRFGFPFGPWGAKRPIQPGDWPSIPHPPGVTYWAAMNGSNSNPGDSEDRPVRTIQRAVDLAGAGDTVYIKAGTYQRGFSLQDKGGTDPNNPLFISCAPGDMGDVWIIPPPVLGCGSEVISLDGSSTQHVWINGLNIVGPRWYDDDPNTDPGTSCIVFSGGAGYGSHITNCAMMSATHCGVRAGQSTTNTYIEGCIVFENGEDANSDHGVYMLGNNHTLCGNIVMNNTGWGIYSCSTGGSDPQNHTIARNICFSSGNPQYGGIAISGSNHKVYHNDCFASTLDLEMRGTGELSVIRNNLFANSGQAISFTNGADPNDHTIDHNHVYDPNSFDPNVSAPSANPRLVDPNTGDFRLYGLSPCVDAGMDLSAQFATAGLPYAYVDPNKPSTAPDIGALEYIPGDTNADDKCNIDDYIDLIGHYGQAGAMADGDTNGDGQVNIDDYIDLIGNYDYALGAAAAAPGTGGEDVALEVSISVAGNVASASITGDTYGNTSYTYVWTASSATNTVYACGGPIVTFDIDQPGQYVVTVTVFGNVGGKATAVYRYLTVE